MNLCTTSDGRHIVSSSLSSDGTYICTAFTTRVTLYRIHQKTTSLKKSKRQKKMSNTRSAADANVSFAASGFVMVDHSEDESIQSALTCFRRGAQVVEFFPETNAVAIASLPKNGRSPVLSVLDIPPVNVSGRMPKLRTTLVCNSNGRHNNIDSTPYNMVCISMCDRGSKQQTVAACTEHGTIRIWSLTCSEVALQAEVVPCFTLPSLDSNVYCRNLSFSSSGESLVVLCDDNTFHVWDVDLSAFSKWWTSSKTKQAPSTEGAEGAEGAEEQLSLVEATRKHVPVMLRQRMDRTRGVVQTSTGKAGMLLYGPGYLCSVDFGKPLPNVNADLLLRSDKEVGGLGRNRKVGHNGSKKQIAHERWTRKMNKMNKGKKNSTASSASGAPGNFRMVDRFRPIYYAASLGENEMLVVEKPWLSVLQKLPNPVYRKKYGKS